MLLTIEKVLILKSVSIFSEIPEESLVSVASVLELRELKPGEDIVKQGEIGTSMYIIANGKVSVRVGDREVATLGEREIFGELAALDSEPRSATVTALEDTTVFRLGQEAIYELMGEHTDLTRGIIAVLCRRLRAQ